MKRILFIACLLISQLGFGQCTSYSINCFNFDYSDSTLLDTFYFPNPSTNIWDIGVPQKTIFDSTLFDNTTNIALVTDTVNPYPPNDTSYFILEMKYPFYPDPFYNTSVFGLMLSFDFKMDSDSLNDFGKIEVSIDTGQTWVNLFDSAYLLDNNGIPSYTIYWFVYNSSFSSFLTDSIGPFTGTHPQWNRFHYDNFGIDFERDEIIQFKFSFISDSMDTQKEGWLIDNIRIGNYASSTFNASTPKFPSKVIPNPSANEQVWIQFDNDSYDDITIEIYTTTGQFLQRHNTREGEIPIILRDKGIYFYRLRNLETQEISLGKIVRL